MMLGRQEKKIRYPLLLFSVPLADFYSSLQISVYIAFIPARPLWLTDLKQDPPMFLFPILVLNIVVVVTAVQSLSRVWLFATPWTAAHQASLSFTISRRLLKLMSIESVMPCNHLILCHPLLPRPQSFPTSRSFPVSQLFASGGQTGRPKSFQWIFRFDFL